jgi:phage-related protein
MKYMPVVQSTFSKMWEICKHAWDSIGQPIFDMVQAYVERVAVVFSEKMPEIRDFVSQCFEDIQVFWEQNLKPCLDAIKKFLTEVLAPIFETVFIDYIAVYVDNAFGFIKDLWNDTLMPVFTGITDFLTGIFTGNWKQAFDGIVGIVKGAFSGIVNTAKTAVNQVTGFVNKIISAINSVKIPDWVPGIGGGNLSIPEIPKLATGGVLKKGEIGLLEGDGAEAVVPLEQNRAWISAVAKDMDSSMGGKETVGMLGKILDAISKTNDELEGVKDSFASMKVELNNREFGRLVKAVN